jgi:glyoxylase-like metal-dependent hydrolase (beta-lactamase superfamily II)
VIAWTDLGAGIHVRHSVAYRMTSVVLLDPAHTVVVDPGVLPSEIADVARVAAGASPAATSLILTHPHWDHVLGRAWFPGARTIAHAGFAVAVARDAAGIATAAAALAARHGERWKPAFAPLWPDEPVSGVRFLKPGPWRLVLREAPGHCDQQLTVHLPDTRTLIAADMLSDVEIPGLSGPPARYRATLEELLPLAEHGAIETLIPGHGAIARGREAVLARFRHDLDYLAALTAGVARCVAGGATLAATIERLAALEYTGKSGEPWPRADVHRENVGHAWTAATRPAGRGRNRPRRGAPPAGGARPRPREGRP